MVSVAEAAATNRPLDKWNVPLIAASYPGYLSGKAVHYCSPQTFTTPVNIERLVAATNNAEYACTDTGCGWAPHTVGTGEPTGVCTVPLAPPRRARASSTDQVKADMSTTRSRSSARGSTPRAGADRARGPDRQRRRAPRARR